MRVPVLPFHARTADSSPPWQAISAPADCPAARDCSVTCATPPMDAKASPRKPRVRTWKRSSAVASLLVAWLAKARGRSSASMPQPSSTTRISSAPPCSTSMSMRVAPASTEFSSNSLTTLAGRSMTSPAAILVTTESGSCWMRGMSLRVESQAPSLDLSFQRRRLHVELRGGFLQVAARLTDRVADLVLKLPFLDVPVQRPFTDAQELGRLLAIV